MNNMLKLRGATFVLISFFMLMFDGLYAQHQIEWIQHVGSSGRDVLDDFDMDENGNIYCVGTFSGFFSGFYSQSELYIDGQNTMQCLSGEDGFIYKSDKNGKLLWSKHIHEHNNLYGSEEYACLVRHVQGGIYVLGGMSQNAIIEGSTNEDHDKGLFVSFLNENGQLQWIKYISSYNQNDNFTSAVAVKDNSIYLIIAIEDSTTVEGKVYDYSKNGSELLVKYNQAGVLQWSKLIEPDNYSFSSNSYFDHGSKFYLSHMYFDKQDQLHILGHSNRSLIIDNKLMPIDANGANAIFDIKLDQDGNPIDSKTLLRGKTIQLNGLCLSPSNELYLSGGFRDTLWIQGKVLTTPGYTYDIYEPGTQNVYFTKLAENGKMEWLKKIESDRNIYMENMTINQRGELILAYCGSSSIRIEGSELKHNSYFDDIYLSAFSGSGKILWNETYYGTGEDFPCKLEIDKENNIIMGASFQDNLHLPDDDLYTTGDPDFIFAKILDKMDRTVKISGATFLCAGDSITLSANLSRCKSYDWNNGLCKSRSITIYKPGIYKLNVVDQYGNNLSDSLIVTSIHPPALFSGKDTSMCAGTTLNIIAPDKMVSYKWDNGTAARSLLVNKAGLYSFVMSDTLGCLYKDSIHVTERQKPAVHLTDNDFCNTSIGEITAMTEGSTSGQWQYFGGNNLTFSDDRSSTTQLKVDAPGLYKIIYEAKNEWFCTALDSANVKFTADKKSNLLKAACSVDNKTCYGDTVSVSAINAESLNYHWNFSDMPVVSSDNSGSYKLDLSKSNLNMLSLWVDKNGCFSDTLKIKLKHKSHLYFSSNLNAGCEPLSVDFSSNVSDKSSVTWSIDGFTAYEHSVKHVFKRAGSFDIGLKVIDADGCENTSTQRSYIQVYPKPVAGFSSNPALATLENPLVSFNNNSQNADVYRWDFGDSITSMENSPGHLYKDRGTFVVKLIAQSSHACIDSMLSVVSVVGNTSVATAIAPFSNIEKNRVFYPLPSGLNVSNYVFKVYNRWGNLVFSSTEPQNGWDGRIGDQAVNAGAFVWVVTYRDYYGKEHKNGGTLMLVN